MKLLGIDTGGTFTDFAYHDGRTLRTHKVLSTPQAPEQAILAGVREMDLPLAGLRVIHGSTVATNAVLEGKGARTVYITNRGLKDVLTIGRQARRELYNLLPVPVPPPVPEELLIETGGRLAADGTVVEDLTAADLDALLARVRALQPEAAAINLLFSFRDDRFERRIAAALPADLFVSCGSQVLREYREYERGICTWLNACIGPLVQRYLERLALALEPALLTVMRSSGDTCAADQAGREAVHLMLSGPAGGLAGARFAASAAACGGRIMTIDMGGTSTDVALIDGAVALTSTGRIAGYPVGVPMVDMHTIGAGGGSIAYVDAGGGLQVGPRSAGADPGPACYGLGGVQATVTDANLVAGRLPAGARLAGRLATRMDLARAALGRLARELGLESAEEAASGVIRIANEHMVQALRVISVQRGIDPRRFTLVAFGGAGGMHACDLADALDMRRVLAPAHAGVLSALGMLIAPPGRQLSRTVGRLLEPDLGGLVDGVLRDLSREGRAALIHEGVESDTLRDEATVDLCYRGQAFTLNLPWREPRELVRDFHAAHEARYGHRLEAPVELINVRLGVRAPGAGLTLPSLAVRAGGVRDPAGGVWQRGELAPGRVIPGPARVFDAVATVYIAPGWRGRADACGNLLLERD